MDIKDIGDSVSRCKNGDQEAWNMIIQAYSKPVFNLALHFIGDRDMASDLTQEIFIKVYNNIEKYKDEKSFSAWVFAVARNYCIDFWRKNKKYIQMEEIHDNMSMEADSPEEETVKKSEIFLLRKMMQKLDPEQRLFLTLRDILHLSYQQISEKMEIPEGTVKSRINRARLKLTRLYLQQGDRYEMQ